MIFLQLYYSFTLQLWLQCELYVSAGNVLKYAYWLRTFTALFLETQGFVLFCPFAVKGLTASEDLSEKEFLGTTLVV